MDFDKETEIMILSKYSLKDEHNRTKLGEICTGIDQDFWSTFQFKEKQ